MLWNTISLVSGPSSMDSLQISAVASVSSGKLWEPQQWTSDMDALLLEHEANIWLIPSRSTSCMPSPTTWTPDRRTTNLFNLELTPLRAMTTFPCTYKHLLVPPVGS